VSVHTVQWVSASPLWSGTLNGGSNQTALVQQMRQPAVLRFTQDTFMVALAQILAQEPSTLSESIAVPATYRLAAPGESQPPQPTELKLFQAAHGHFYLVAASLTCRLPGLPDHDVDTAAKERVAFVLRRVEQAQPGSTDTTTTTEWSWGDDPSNPGNKVWSQIDSSEVCSVAENEDLMPLFPVRYQLGDTPRRIYVGLVPTSSLESFKAAGTLSPLAPPSDTDPGAAPLDPRPQALTNKVTDPLRALAAAPTTAPSDATDPSAVVQAETDQLVEASQFLLVDFAEYLVNYLPDLWNALKSGTPPGDAAAAALYVALDENPADSSQSVSWRDALTGAWSTATVLYGDATGPAPDQLNLGNSPQQLTGDQLDALVGAALPTQTPNTSTDLVTSVQGDAVDPPQVPKLNPQWSYQIRCVYQRPLCGALQPDVVSDPTTAFEIASFFDLDAPSRQIYISLPVNTGIGDLRKLRKNVNFMISNQLRNQMNRVTSLKDALNGQFASGGSVDLGLMCSFSIPIITICALLVLLIFIELLNIVFWWLPFLRICFPTE
jgi:hypothetical protein